VDPLAGWTIAVTADRRADEQAQMLEARGARVLSARSVASRPLPEAELRARTQALLAEPPATVIANTATGVRSWIALAWSWGLGDDLVRMLGETRLVARGTKAAGALMSEGLDVAWMSSTETLDDVFEHVSSTSTRGARVALQCDGRGDGVVGGALRDRGFDVVELPVYRVDPLVDERAAGRLVASLEATPVDAITFTSPAAVAGFDVLVAAADGPLIDRTSIVCACVGTVTATAASDAGFEQVVVPQRSRLGPMVRVLTDRMATLGREFGMAGRAVRLQGGRLAIADRHVQLTPRERTLLEALVGAGGAVVSKQALARVAWSEPVEEHTVEVTVNRLRRKLGGASTALETSNRRGYRLAMTETSRAAAATSGSCEREVTTA
jgi:uroporphyrinogen-III synthase